MSAINELFQSLGIDVNSPDTARFREFLKLGKKAQEIKKNIEKLVDFSGGDRIGAISRYQVIVNRKEGVSVCYKAKSYSKLKDALKKFDKIKLKVAKWAYRLRISESGVNDPEHKQPTHIDGSPETRYLGPDIVLWLRRLTEVNANTQDWNIDRQKDVHGELRTEINSQLAIASAFGPEIYNSVLDILSDIAGLKRADRETKNYAYGDIAGNSFFIAGSLFFGLIKLSVAHPGYFLNETVTSKSPILDYPLLTADHIGMAEDSFNIWFMNALWMASSGFFIVGGAIFAARNFKLMKKSCRLLKRLNGIDTYVEADNQILRPEKNEKKALLKLRCLLEKTTVMPYEIEAIERKYPDDKAKRDEAIAKLQAKKSKRFQRTAGSNAALMVERDAMFHYNALADRTKLADGDTVKNATRFVSKVEKEVEIQKSTYKANLIMNILWVISSIFWLAATFLYLATLLVASVSGGLALAFFIMSVVAAVFCFIVASISMGRFFGKLLKAHKPAMDYLADSKPHLILKTLMVLLFAASIVFLLSALPFIGPVAMWIGMSVFFALMPPVVYLSTKKNREEKEQIDDMQSYMPNLMAERYFAKVMEAAARKSAKGLSDQEKNFMAQRILARRQEICKNPNHPVSTDQEIADLFSLTHQALVKYCSKGDLTTEENDLIKDLKSVFPAVFSVTLPQTKKRLEKKSFFEPVARAFKKLKTVFCQDRRSSNVASLRDFTDPTRYRALPDDSSDGDDSSVASLPDDN